MIPKKYFKSIFHFIHSQLRKMSPDLIVGQIIGLALALPSFPLYIIQCAIVIGNRKSNNFNTIFYKFFLLEAFNVWAI
jgi:hypothetical protein